MSVKNLQGEIWRYVMSEEIGFYPYMISDKGRVKSLSFNKTGKEKLLKQKQDKDGYLTVGLRRKGERKWFRVHRLVALMFIKNPDNLPCVNHIDENKSNNTAENLEFCSIAYNNAYNDGVSKRQKKRKETIKTSVAWKEGLERRKETIKNSNAWMEGHKKRATKLSKQVYQYDQNFEFVRSYESARLAAAATGYSQGNISSCCRANINSPCTTKYKTAYNYVWSYEPITKVS